MDSGAQNLRLDGGNFVSLSQISYERVHFVIEPAKHWIIHPRLLDKLELPLNIAVETDKMKTALLSVVDEQIL
jgi:hypothetical protein